MFGGEIYAEFFNAVRDYHSWSLGGWGYICRYLDRGSEWDFTREWWSDSRMEKGQESWDLDHGVCARL